MHTNKERAAMKKRLETWRVQSPEKEGFHEIFTPGKNDCAAVHVFRLNLPKGATHIFHSCELELHPVLLHGAARITDGPLQGKTMSRFDSFYIPGNTKSCVEAVEDCVFYVAGAICDGIGKPSFRQYDATLPIGDIHQIHGAGAGRREVMFTLDPATPASRLICGLTWGGVGAWTSWPPHQHEQDLEEAYCYFDMPAPAFGLHISYLHSGEFEDLVAHPVSSGTMVLAPRGYHPTVASPATRNTYLWILAAFTPESRSYDLAVLDPAYAKT
ncbi:MAG: 5-deoxy-glucuronate isomerase [Desulfovibrio sp.]